MSLKKINKFSLTQIVHYLRGIVSFCTIFVLIIDRHSDSGSMALNLCCQLIVMNMNENSLLKSRYKLMADGRL